MVIDLSFSLLLTEDAPPPAEPSSLPIPPPVRSLRPNLAVIAGVVTAMLSVTFLLILYAKHCKRHDGGDGGPVSGFPASSGRRDSGVNRAVVESLPLFRFGSLLGRKEGLECAVCLDRFGPEEALRLLPKCRHGFHVECVDTWLDAHSSCPLCRARVEPDDLLLVTGPKPEPDPAVETAKPSAGRVSGRHSSAGEKSSSSLLRVVVDRAKPDGLNPRRKDGILPTEAAGEAEELERRCGHRISVDGCAASAEERWSDLRPSDLLFLRTEMIITGSGRFSAGRMSCSSIGGSGVITSRTLSPTYRASRREEERTMSQWLRFAAKRTARWLGRREDGDGS